ncbi:MAG: hypothetical protein N3G77_07325, partial [Nitrososphaeria archaeon]|nr:hypothetical protein [Nitrososphaeria archaeon]
MTDTVTTTVTTTITALSTTTLYLATYWIKVYRSIFSDQVRDIEKTLDGGYILAGWSYSDVLNFLLVKLDSWGNVEWHK